MIYELLICVKDENDLVSGHKRKKEGDIIAVRPRQRKSTTEVDHWEMQRINKLDKNVPIMKDINDDFHWGRKEIDQYLIVPFESDDLELQTKLQRKSASGDKNAFKVDLNDLKANYCPELDLVKVRDKKIIYQPFKKESKLVEKQPTIDLKNVDTGLSKESEIIAGVNPVNLIYSKEKSQYVDVRNEAIVESE
jgi:hypothetical protein